MTCLLSCGRQLRHGRGVPSATPAARVLFGPHRSALARDLAANLRNANGGGRIERHSHIICGSLDRFLRPLDDVFVPERERGDSRIGEKRIPCGFVITQGLKLFVDCRRRVSYRRRLPFLRLLGAPDPRTPRLARTRSRGQCGLAA